MGTVPYPLPSQHLWVDDFPAFRFGGWNIFISSPSSGVINQPRWNAGKPPENEWISPKKRSFQKENSLPSIIFQGKNVSFQGGSTAVDFNALWKTSRGFLLLVGIYDPKFWFPTKLFEVVWGLQPYNFPRHEVDNSDREWQAKQSISS